MGSELARLHQFILDHYSLEEVRTLCFKLDVSYDDLGGEGRAAKARELLLKVGRQQRFDALLRALQQAHPELFHEEGFSTDQSMIEALISAELFRKPSPIDKVDDRHNQITLKSYRDIMDKLILKDGLGTSEEKEGARNIAKERTLVALTKLDATQVEEVFRYIHVADLKEVISLADEDLTHVNWESADLRKANLRNANLRDVLLQGATLRKAILCDADLRRADLSEARLSRADLSGALLEGARVTQEQLDKAKSLEGATMPDGTKYEG